MKLNNKVAIVTGAGKRLGRQIAIALAEGGFNVVVNYFNSKLGAQQTITAIENLGMSAIAVKADVSKKKEVDSLVKSTMKKFDDFTADWSSYFIIYKSNCTS